MNKYKKIMIVINLIGVLLICLIITLEIIIIKTSINFMLIRNDNLSIIIVILMFPLIQFFLIEIIKQMINNTKEYNKINKVLKQYHDNNNV